VTAGLAFATRLLRRLPAETAHDLAIRGLAVVPRLKPDVPAGLEVRLAGLDLAHPLGLAAGFDKNAAALSGLARLGFACIEAGTVTPRPQAGNPRPRLFRLPEDRAIINRMGFNNAGLDAFARKLEARPRDVVIGANIGINKDETAPASAYARGADRLLPLADYLTVNVSSPNTPGLRDLQERRALTGVLEAVTAARDRHVDAGGRRRPIFLKVAPDLDDVAALAIVETATLAAIDGLIVSNTTIARPESLISEARIEPGGLSGRPLLTPSTRLLALMARHAAGRLAFIGVGGIGSGADAYAKLKAGATALQLYTAFVYEGPGIIQRILDELVDCLARDGFATVTGAVGAEL
jgi:dihydroorotate dehydrogenase